MTQTVIAGVSEAPRALRSLYGASERQKNTVKSMASPGERPQEIYTPHCVIDAVLQVWPSIELDPCWGPGSVVPAAEAYYVPPRLEVTYRRDKKTGITNEKVKTHFTANPGELDGLVEPWRDYTFVNPPFKLLEEWLKKAQEEAALGHEIMLLAPTRAHRKWFRSAERSATKVCDLNPLTFEGYKSAFPAPLCVFYWGGAGSVFEQAFRKLGDC